uniref:AMP_N domain-containing protein n=1 Tax=Globodera pallida TaxID=36090 RepID=A0A183BU84_GLOPA
MHRKSAFVDTFLHQMINSTRIHVKIAEKYRARARLLELIENARTDFGAKQPFALLFAKRKSFSAPDVPHVYRQCSHFRYLCGVDRPGFRLLVGPKESVLFYAPQTTQQILWDGASPSSDQLKSASGVDKILPLDEFDPYMAGTVQDGLLGLELRSLMDHAVEEPELKKVWQMIADGAWTHVELGEHVDTLRWRKSDAEKALMRRTCAIGGEALNAMLRSTSLLCSLFMILPYFTLMIVLLFLFFSIIRLWGVCIGGLSVVSLSFMCVG